MDQEILDPDELVAEAKRRWEPIRSIALFSGGNDSGVLAFRCRDHFDELFFIDTGVCLPGVEEHCERFAALLGKPLSVLRSGNAYERMVLGTDLWWERFELAKRTSPSLTIDEMIELDKADAKSRGKRRVLSSEYGEAPHGFPGKGHHGKAYSRLKERRIEEKLRLTKEGHPRTSTVLFLSGIRRDESNRRAKRNPLTERYSAKFVNPLIDWTNAKMAIARDLYGVPQSDVAALLHRSGECQCGAFADAEEERKMLKAFWPDWFARVIEPLEQEAERRGIRWCRWGGYDLSGVQAAGAEDPGMLCQSCPTRQL